MRGADLSDALSQHAAWLSGSGGKRANLRGADLRGAGLLGADLRGAYLSGADLRDADLFEASLCGTNLRGANLCRANLRDANLCDAVLCDADLCDARLPSPTVVLLAQWGHLPDALTVDLMRYDAACHPDPEAFSRWAAGGGCPYFGVMVQRAASFFERRDLWSPGPSPRPYDLMVAVLAAKCPPWTDARRAEFEARRAKEAP